MKRIPFETMKLEILRVLQKKGFTEERANECALLFSESSLDGVYSHGLNRVPRFIEYIEKGWININAEPEKLGGMGVIEKYDGKFGPGNLNAKFCMDRAINISKTKGIGIVTVRNTNHWMRGGSYGWQAANEGCIGICWTNTESSMPPWGAKEIKIGNNPLVMAIPKKDGNIVLDMAMSQFSYGKLEVTRLNNEFLPIPGGYDDKGELTKNPALIEKSQRLLPTGYWKGSGLAIVLDLIATLISEGNSTSMIDEIKPGNHVSCYGISQVFISFDIQQISNQSFIETSLMDAINDLHSAETIEDGRVYYPGERTIAIRKENFKKGIPVDEEIWEKVRSI